MPDPMRLRRSLLIAPASNWDLLKKLSTSPADICTLELEDGVHPSMKSEARQTAARALRELDWGSRERVVRINRLASEDGLADVRAVVPAAPDALILPKVESEFEVQEAGRLLAETESEAGVPKGTVRLWPMIETAKALGRVEAICDAGPRVAAVIFGAGDYAADIRVKRLGLGSNRRVPGPAHEYFYARGRVVAAARAAGIDPIDVGHSTFRDLEGTKQTAEISAQMGFTGSVVFSPRQLPIINEVFSPSEDDLAWAREVLEKIDDAGAEDEPTAVVVVDGDMVDGPFVVNARNIVALQAAIEAVEAATLPGAR